MAKIKRFTTADGGYHGELGFYCPGCDSVHFIIDEESNVQGMPVWQFNENFDLPTVRASVMLTRPGYVCHSFITDGKIQFLSDCTHHLAGQTVDLNDI